MSRIGGRPRRAERCGRVILVFAILFFATRAPVVFPAPGAGPADESAADVVARMDALWEKRASPGAMERIVALGKEALGDAGHDGEARRYDLLWRMARARWWTGHSTRNLARRREACEQARALADEARALRPGGVEAALVYAFAVGDYATSIGIVRALVEGVATEVESAMRRAYELDRDYEHGSAMAALGRYYWRLPWPLRDLERSRRHLEEARSRHPRALAGRFFLAETYRSLGLDDEAEAELRFVVAHEPLPDRRPEDEPIRERARRRLREWLGS